jgi:hypothetical protein
MLAWILYEILWNVLLAVGTTNLIGSLERGATVFADGLTGLRE